MAVTPISETRSYDRQLEYARETVLPGIFDNSKDKKPFISVVTGALATPMFGGVGLQGRGKRVQSGGESIRIQLRVGQNSTVSDLSGPYASFDTTPQSNVIHERANWKLYGGTVNIDEHTIQTQGGGHGLANIVEDELRAGAEDLLDRVSPDIYDNTGVATRVTDLDSIVSANDSVHGVSGATYARWNSRGLSARGTAAASISFAGGSFASTGLSNWRIAWENASEGTEEPHALFTTHDIKTFYEGSLQPQERFNSPRLADGGFRFLEFKTAPIFPDPDCPTGVTYFINFDHLYLNVLSGADFTSGPFSEPIEQRVRIAKLFATVELTCDTRFLQNKVTGQTA